ncbi:hypothetical protein [Brevibacillus centrosporus]|uniref:hypothetical protein n=1 Tax=Brevibacillus centrosporus TaxID=54910 RepID=UPI002E1B7BC6|nr:hypothetical protein [Brevibacillus centrosporus]
MTQAQYDWNRRVLDSLEKQLPQDVTLIRMFAKDGGEVAAAYEERMQAFRSTLEERGETA